MPKRPQLTPADFTIAELEAMLATKTESEKLEEQRDGLMKELAAVEKKIEKLAASLAAKKPGRKKKAAKKTATSRVAKKAGRKASPRAAKASKKKAVPAKGRVTVESVVVDLLTKAGEPMAFKDILATIQKKKLVKTKSKDFGNVLRRTLATSKAVKRVGRGVYDV